MFVKIWFLSYGPKTLKINQNIGFFKSQYLRKNSRYEVEFLEVEFLDMIRGPRKH